MTTTRTQIYVHGVGHFHPANIIDNAFLESLDIGTNDAWITERVGIRQRHTVLPLDYIRTTRNADVRATKEASLYSNADMAAKAATLALSRAGIEAKDIGLVIAGFCACLVGIFLVMPLLSIAHMYIYLKLTGQMRDPLDPDGLKYTITAREV